MALTRARYSQIFDTDYKQSVRLATTTDVGNLLISGNVVSTVDGITVSVNDRILVKDQADAKQNGIYRVVTVGSGTDGTWVRAQDADSVGNGKVTSGMTTTVTEGSANASKTFKLSTPDPIVVGTTELTFVNPFLTSAGGANTAVQFNDAGTVSGSSAFVFNKYSNVLTISGNVSAGNILTSNILYPNGSPYLIGGGTVSISSSNTAPVSPTVGDFWYDTSEDILFQYIDDGVNEIWVDLSGDPAQVVTGTPNKQFYANKVQVGTSEYLLDTFPAAGNTLVTWTVSAKDNIGNNIRSSTIHSVNDGTDVYWTEYGIIQSNSSVNVATFTSNISSGNIRLYTTGDSANVSITFQRLLLGSDTTTGYIMGGTAGPSGPTGTIEDTSGIIKTTNTTISTSSTTGALQVAGGAGIGGNVYIQSGNQFNIGADLANLTLTGNVLSIDLSPMHVFSDADANNRIIVQNVNSGSNASSGMTFVADNGDITNNFLDIGINNSTNDDGLLYRNDGFLHVIGGNIMIGALSLAKNIHFHVGDMTTEDHMVGMFDANSFHVMKSTVSSSTTTGALRVHGGVGIEGNVYAGNVTATYLYGNGSQLTGITTDATSIQSGTSNVKSLSSSNVTVSVAGTSNVAVFTSTNIEIAGNLIPSANVTYNLGSSTRRWNVGYFAANTIDLGGSTISAGASGISIGNLTVTNITANTISGNGSQLTGIFNSITEVVGGDQLVDDVDSSSFALTNGTFSSAQTKNYSKSLYVNQVNERLTISPLSLPMTVECWFYYDDNASPCAIMTVESDGPDVQGMAIIANGGVYYQNTSGGSTSANGDFTPTAGWHHYVLYFSSTSVTTWVDGVRRRNSNIVSGYEQTLPKTKFTFGAKWDDNDAWEPRGYYDSVRISSGDIYGTSNATITSPSIFTETASTLHLLHYTTGGIYVGNLTASGNISAGNLSGTLTTAAQPNITQVGQLANLTVGGNLTVTGQTTFANSITLPTWTTNTRPSSGNVTGTTGYNTTTAQIEVYNATYNSWVNAGVTGITYQASYLVIAGGGGGGSHAGSGAGAGGYRNSVSGELSGGSSSAETPMILNPGVTYTLTVGAGAAAAVNSNGSNGSNSSISGSGLTTITSLGGAGGRGGASQGPGFDGGSGSGGAADPTAYVGGSGTAGQGTNGGTNSSNWGTGGGGGAGTAGANGSGSNAGAGGNGLSSSITGSAVTRGGGGGGSSQTGSAAAGGSGGGGNGANTGTAGSGSPNTGGGGGGMHAGGAASSGAGGSGVIILRIPTANYTGTTTGSPTVSISGSDTILVYNSSGSYTA